MPHLIKLLLGPALASTLLLAGCEGSDTHGDHPHSHSEGGGHGDDEQRGDGHGAEIDLGEVTIAGSVLHVAIGGEPEPGVTLHLHLELKDGPTPAAVRVWVGDESATGSIKGKAVASHGKYHVDAACPAELSDDALLWIEVETDRGEREAKSLPLASDKP